MNIINLRTEYKINPLGIDIPNPRLSYEILSSERNTKQIAFQIQAASSETDLFKGTNLLWDTGKIDSDQSIHIEYQGTSPEPRQKIHWKVKAWDNHGNESDWSEPAHLETGLMDPANWNASWIEPNIKENKRTSNPCPHLRKEFELKKNIQRARIYVSGQGLFQLYVNGSKVSDDLFAPGWTSYQKRLQYLVYDVTRQLKPGQNALGAILGDGWYRGPLAWNDEKNFYGDKLALILQLFITYEDGSEDIIVTDETWKSVTGPILKSEIYDGEVYDARLEMSGWNHAGFNDINWNSVILKNHDKNNLVAAEDPPVRITEVVHPVKKFITPDGDLVFDLGQIITGWVAFSLQAPAGTKITLRHAETLDQEGNFYNENLRKARQEVQYTFNGENTETFEPHFTFHGFRYISVEGYPGEISLNDITGKVIHSDMKQTGKFECSNELVNRLQKNIQWSLRGNFLDIPTDCPQRDERLGWTGDAQVFAPTACFNMDVATFISKWMKDLAADQKEDGQVPWVIPNILDGGGGTGWSDGTASTGWADAALIIPWTIYQVYGDKKILETQYKSMKAWVDYMKNQAGDSCLYNTGFHFGDWLSFAEYHTYNYNAPDYGYAGANTDKDLIATAYFYYSTTLLQKIATLLGEKQDADDCEILQKKIKSAFQKEFLTETGRLSSNTQTAYSIALSFGLLPDELIKSAVERLAKDVQYFGHLTTGFLGTPLICLALTDNGYAELAYMLLLNDRYPSWLYPVTKGATTIWERWDGIKPDGTFQNPGMNSFNHYAYGAVGHWLYSKVAGIQTNPGTPGYKKIIIKPYISEQLQYAKASFQSMYGKIESGWHFHENKLILEVLIPANTTAEIHIPANNAEQILLDGLSTNKNNNIKLLDMMDDRVVYETGSGNYLFEITDYEGYGRPETGDRRGLGVDS